MCAVFRFKFETNYNLTLFKRREFQICTLIGFTVHDVTNCNSHKAIVLIAEILNMPNMIDGVLNVYITSENFLVVIIRVGELMIYNYY